MEVRIWYIENYFWQQHGLGNFYGKSEGRYNSGDIVSTELHIALG